MMKYKLLLLLLSIWLSGHTYAQSRPEMGSAAPFAVIAGATFTDNNPGVIKGLSGLG